MEFSSLRQHPNLSVRAVHVVLSAVLQLIPCCAISIVRVPFRSVEYVVCSSNVKSESVEFFRSIHVCPLVNLPVGCHSGCQIQSVCRCLYSARLWFLLRQTSGLPKGANYYVDYSVNRIIVVRFHASGRRPLSNLRQ